MSDVQKELQLTCGTGKSSRRKLDAYPTPPEVTFALVDRFPYLTVKKILEPAAGKGFMAEALQDRGCFVVAQDIEFYEDPLLDVYRADFLETESLKYDAIITNPPFCIAEEFIRKAVGEAPFVAMLLKTQFWHAKKRSQLFKDHPPAFILPLTWRPDFYLHEREGKAASPTMDCCWNVWIEGVTDTKYEILNRPEKVVE